MKQEGPLPNPEGEAQRPLIGTLGGDSRSPGRPLQSKPGRFKSDYLHQLSGGPGRGASGGRPL